MSKRNDKFTTNVGAKTRILHEALWKSFAWVETEEGIEFWFDIARRLNTIAKDAGA